jgi:hypothetical protein
MKKTIIIFILSLVIALMGFIYFNTAFSEDKEQLLKFEQDEIFSNFKNLNSIDFTDINYFASETKRDEKLEEAFAEIYHLEQWRDEIRYYYNRIDLNGDKRQEIFVLLVGRMVCGSGGCSALIFEDKNGEYDLVSRFSLVNNPIIISNTTTNGWKDIIIPVAGGGIKSFFAQMKFDGDSYPLNPSVQPEVKADKKVRGKAIISDDLSKSPGIEF